MSIQIILTTKVEHLGAEGTTVKVADGYARNFLIPQGLAMAATAGNLRRVAAMQKKRETDEAASLTDAREIESRLTKQSFTINAPAGADEKLFGSVTAVDIAEALAKEGIVVDRKKIVIEHPIRTCGVFDVDVKLHSTVATKVKIWVVAAEAAPAVSAAAPAAAAPKKPKKK